MCTKPFSQTKNNGKQFLVSKSSGSLLGRMPLNLVGVGKSCTTHTLAGSGLTPHDPNISLSA